MQQGADHAIRAGKLLLEAKIAVPHGHFEEWQAANCRFSLRSAQLYMQLAREFPQGVAPGTSLTAAIKMVEQLKSPEEKLSSTGRQQRGKRNWVAEAIKVDPVAVLEKAWAAASEMERNIFVKKIERDIQPKQ